MKIELILLGIIGLVFLIDFIKKRSKSSFKNNQLLVTVAAVFTFLAFSFLMHLSNTYFIFDNDRISITDHLTHERVEYGDIAIERLNGALTHYTRNNMEKFTGIIYNNEKGNMGLVVNGLRTNFWRSWDTKDFGYDKSHYIEVEYGSNGRADGLLMLWYSDGSIAQQSYFRSGEYHGELIAWYNNGQLAEKTTYNMGSVINTKKWDRYGNKK
jgi:antitoxin component YwqK of YwqJK toxin-antitoxin module